MQWRPAGRHSRYVVGVLACGVGLAAAMAAAQPAYALAPIPVTVSVIPPPEFTPGAQQRIDFAVTNGTPGVNENTSLTATIVIQASGGSPSPDFTFAAGPTCLNAGTVGNTCRFRFPEDGAGMVRSLSFVVNASSSVADVPAGARTTFGGSTITITDQAADTPVSAGFSVTLDGPSTAPQSTTVSGVVDDSGTGQPLAGATVTLQDSAGHAYVTVTNAAGQFAYTAGAAVPVAPGPFVVSVAKTGYQPFSSTPHTFTPGTDITGLTLLVLPIAAVAPSASAVAPSASATAPVSPSTSPGVSASSPRSTADSASQTGGGQIGAGTGGDRTASSGGALDYLLVVGIALLVVGAGVMAYMAWRRRLDRPYAGVVSGPPDDGDTQDLPTVPQWRPPRTPRPVGTPRPAMIETPRPTMVDTAPYARADDPPYRAADPLPAGRSTDHIRSNRSDRVRVYGVDGFSADVDESGLHDADDGDSIGRRHSRL